MHLVGHVGRSTTDDSPSARPVGRLGIEASEEAALRGESGCDLKKLNHRGEPLGMSSGCAEPTPGRDVRLAIDLEAQKCAESLLDRACRESVGALTGNKRPPSERRDCRARHRDW